MKEFPNFFENIKEAQIRLNNTVVTYEGEPYYVVAVSDHKPDGIFRIYLDPVGFAEGMTIERLTVPYSCGSTTGQEMDKWLDQKPSGNKIIRKFMTSQGFNNFKPFPLGMMNVSGEVYFAERSPTRSTSQGLAQNAVNFKNVSLSGSTSRPSSFRWTGPELYDTIKGSYPSAKECIKEMNRPEITNTATAFDRHFAFLQGPCDTLFLAYKRDVVGFMPKGDLSELKLSKKFAFVKEAAADTAAFQSVEIV